MSVIAGNTPANNVRGGHTVHTASDYDNNDTDNHYYWGVNGHNGAGDLAGAPARSRHHTLFSDPPNISCFLTVTTSCGCAKASSHACVQVLSHKSCA